MFEDAYHPGKGAKPRGSVPPMFIAEQLTLALGDKTEDNWLAKCKHDADIDLFILNAQVIHSEDKAEVARQLEAGELFPVFTAYTNTRSRLREINNKAS